MLSKVALTGASGFLGGHLLPILLKENLKLTCLNRPSSRRKTFPDEVQLITGDCLDKASMVNLLTNQDVLVHMASTLFAPAWQSYLENNAKIAHNIVEAFRSLPEEKRPAKIIFVSSLAAAGPCALAPGINEDDIPAPVSGYGWSKLIAEKILTSALGNRVIIIRPPIIYGSGDRGLLPMFKSASKGFGISPGWKRRFPVSAIHARDVSRAITLLIQEDAQGIYHLSDGNEYDMHRICAAMGKATGAKRFTTIAMPLPVMGLTASLTSFWINLLHRTAEFFGHPVPPMPQWNLDKYREARQQGWLADANKITNSLGFTPSLNLEEGMAEAVEGYRELGML